MITRGGSTTNIQHIQFIYIFWDSDCLSLSSFLGTPFAMDFGSRLLPTQVDAVSGHAAVSACEAGTTPCRTGYVGYVMSGFDHPSYCTTPQNTTNISSHVLGWVYPHHHSPHSLHFWPQWVRLVTSKHPGVRSVGGRTAHFDMLESGRLAINRCETRPCANMWMTHEMTWISISSIVLDGEMELFTKSVANHCLVESWMMMTQHTYSMVFPQGVLLATICQVHGTVVGDFASFLDTKMY